MLMIMLAGMSHAMGHTARFSRTLASSTASLYLCTLFARSGWRIASSIKTKNSLCASFASPPAPRMLLRTFTCASKTQYTNASIDWFEKEACLGQTGRCFWCEPVILPVRGRVWHDVADMLVSKDVEDVGKWAHSALPVASMSYM